MQTVRFSPPAESGFLVHVQYISKKCTVAVAHALKIMSLILTRNIWFTGQFSNH